MSAYPLPTLTQHLLTVSDYLALGEDEHGRTELMEGHLVMSPSPPWKHNKAAFLLGNQVLPRLPGNLQVNFDLDVDLQLVPATGPGTCRRPDLLVVHGSAVDRISAQGGVLRASDLVLAVEIVSPGSSRTDHIVKRLEYQDAGVPHYWVVDLDQPVSLLAYQLTDEFGYVEHASATGTFTTEEPFPVTVKLADLG